MKSYSKLDQKDILQFIFHPRQEEQHPKPEESIDFNVNIDKDITLGCRLFIHDIKAPTILYFHGNGETVLDYDLIAPLYNKTGLNFIISSYRGYGWSSGIPTVTSMINDCEPILQKTQQICQQHNLAGPLFVMGRSIGSVAAIDLAYKFDDTFKGLIIESGFADTLPLLSNLGFNLDNNSLQEQDGFGNRDKIASITIPTLILHGAADTIIPIPQAERLQAFSGARAKKFFVVPGADHNSILMAGGEHYFSTIKSFINDITGQTSWRKSRKKFQSTDKND